MYSHMNVKLQTYFFCTYSFVFNFIYLFQKDFKVNILSGFIASLWVLTDLFLLYLFNCLYCLHSTVIT